MAALVRAAALELSAGGFAVSRYANLPHATVHGWPASATGRSAPVAEHPAEALPDEVHAGTGAVAPAVHDLDAQDYARKLRVVRMYGTELRALIALAGRR